MVVYERGVIERKIVQANEGNIRVPLEEGGHR